MSAAVAVIITALTISGCSAPAGPDPAPVTAPMFASDEEAFAAAEATYRAYVDALNEVVFADPDTFEPLYELTRGTLNAADRKNLSHLHATEVTKVGRAHLTFAEVQSSAGGHQQLSLAVCLDVSNVRLTDAAGTSAVDSSRGDIQTMTVLLEQRPDAPTGFIIADIHGRDGAPECEF